MLFSLAFLRNNSNLYKHEISVIPRLYKLLDHLPQFICFRFETKKCLSFILTNVLEYNMLDKDIVMNMRK